MNIGKLLYFYFPNYNPFSFHLNMVRYPTHGHTATEIDRETLLNDVANTEIDAGN